MTYTITIPAFAGAAASTALKDAAKRIAIDAAARQAGWSASENPFLDPMPAAPTEIVDRMAQIEALMRAAAQIDGVEDQSWASQLMDEAMADLSRAAERSTSGA